NICRQFMGELLHPGRPGPQGGKRDTGLIRAGTDTRKAGGGGGYPARGGWHRCTGFVTHHPEPMPDGGTKTAAPAALRCTNSGPRGAHDDLAGPRAAHDDLAAPRAAHDDLAAPRAAHDDLAAPRAAHDDLAPAIQT